MIKILETILGSELTKCKLSIALNSNPIVGLTSNECQICSNQCQSKDCLQSNLNEYVCDQKLTSYNEYVAGIKITAYGYQGKSNNLANFNKREKQLLKGRNLQREHFENQIHDIEKIINEITTTQDRNSSEILHYFHDTSKWANTIAIASERILNKSQGDNFNEKFNNSNSEIKAIYQSSKLIVDSISMIEVYFNPESAQFGEKHRINIYKLFDKVQAILFHTEGKKINKRFRLSGNVRKDVYAYDSFQIIALSLLQNAIKYSKTSEIEIHLDESNDGIFVIVSSIGPIIEQSEYEKIFEKKYRGKYAKSMHYDGMGIGLFISQSIAKYHGFKIEVSSIPNNSSIDSVPLAENCFSFTFPV